MPAAKTASKRKRSALASRSPTSAPISTAPLQHQEAAGNSSKIKVWTPALHLKTLPRQDDNIPWKYSVEVPYAVLILNQPINDVKLFVTVCRNASYIVAADGGLNRLRDLGLDAAREKTCLPNDVTGDLDSVRDDVLKYYSRRRTHVVKDSGQDATDFTKSLRLITTRESSILKDWNDVKKVHNAMHRPAENLDVIVFGGLGGRADQAFSELHHLYLAHEDERISVGDIYLVTPESIIFLLHKGTNLIHTPVGPEQLGESVGIVPLGKPSIITTKGLEWDVQDWRTEIGGQISTSNHIRAREVTVTTSEPVLFTVELAQDPADQNENVNRQADDTTNENGKRNGELSSKRRRVETANGVGNNETLYNLSVPAYVDKIRENYDGLFAEVQTHMVEQTKINKMVLDAIESLQRHPNNAT